MCRKNKKPSSTFDTLVAIVRLLAGIISIAKNLYELFKG